GLSKLTRPLATLAEFYEIPQTLLRHAARDSAPAPADVDHSADVKRWVAKQGKADLQSLVLELLSQDSAGARAKTLAEIHAAQKHLTWPTTPSLATYAELRAAAGLKADQKWF